MKTIPQFPSTILVFLLFVVSNIRAAIYYVDSVGGGDGNSGTSSGSAWKTLTNVNAQTFSPGDSLLFKAGGTWTGQLHPLGSGNSSSVITISSYGAGVAPRIDGGGGLSAIYLYNQQYWDIKQIDVSNTAIGGPTIYGIYVQAEDAGQVNHVHLIDLDVHDVQGNPANTHSGGIFFNVTTIDSITTTWFNDILVSGCIIQNNCRAGLSSSSVWKVRTGSTNTNWTPSTNIEIADNVIDHSSANGILWLVATSPHIHNNVFSYNGNGLTGNAVFPFNCDNALLNNNEAFGTVFDTGDADAGGFDADYECKGTIIEYNYAHDNGLGGIIAVSAPASNGGTPGFNQNPIIRYNIIANNAQVATRVNGFVTGAQIYNNTIYVDALQSAIDIFHQAAWSGTSPDSTSYRNNIVINYSSNSNYKFGASTNTTVDHNLFYAIHPATEPADSNKLTSDPQLTGPEIETTGACSNGWDTADGYKLLSGSPALGSGVLISNNGGFDYYNNPVSPSSAPNRGAYNGAGSAASTVHREFEYYGPYQSSGQTVLTNSDSSADNGQWVYYGSTAVNQYVTYGFYVQPGVYSIALKTKKYIDRGIVQLATSGDGVTFFNKDGPQDLYSSTASFATIAFTNTFTVTGFGVRYVRVTVTGKNPSSSGYAIAMDSLTLTRLNVNHEFENLGVFSITTGKTFDLVADGAADHTMYSRFNGDTTNEHITYAFYVPAGIYAIQVKVHCDAASAIFQLGTSSDDVTFTNIDGTKDLYAGTPSFTTLNFTNTTDFSSGGGIKYFRFSVTSKSSSSTGYAVGLDSITLTKQ